MLSPYLVGSFKFASTVLSSRNPLRLSKSPLEILEVAVEEPQWGVEDGGGGGGLGERKGVEDSGGGEIMGGREREEGERVEKRETRNGKERSRETGRVSR